MSTAARLTVYDLNQEKHDVSDRTAVKIARDHSV